MSESSNDSVISDMEDWEDEEVLEDWFSSGGEESSDEPEAARAREDSEAAKDPASAAAAAARADHNKRPLVPLPDSEYIRSNKDLYISLLGCKDLRLLSYSVPAQEALLASLVIEVYTAGQVIFREAEASFSVYFVIASSEDSSAEFSQVEVVKDTPDGQKVLTRLGRGQMFGQKYFLTNIERQRSASIRIPADCPCKVRVARLDPEHFHLWKGFRNTQLILTIPLIQLVPQEEREFIVENIIVREFATRQMIACEGELGTELFIIREGSAEVVKEQIGEDPAHIVTLKEGHIFGEMALVKEEPRVASVVALSPTICLCLSKEAFKAASTQAPIFCKVINNIVEQRQDLRANRDKNISTVPFRPQGNVILSPMSSPVLSNGALSRTNSLEEIHQGSSAMTSNGGADSFSSADFPMVPDVDIEIAVPAPSLGQTRRRVSSKRHTAFLVSDDSVLASSSNNRRPSMTSSSSSSGLGSDDASGWDHSANSTGDAVISPPLAVTQSTNDYDQYDSSDSEVSVKITSTVTMRKLSSGSKIINKYAVLKELGKGSFGDVYLCRDEETDQLRAMKAIYRSNQNVNDMEAVRREIAVFKKLRHPNIVRMYEVIDDPTSRMLFIIQEYMEGGTMLPKAVVTERIPPTTARKYFRDIICGVHYLHSLGIIHRDIKPENLLLSKEGVVKLADFGASVQGMSFSNASTIGTPAFMAPEICTNNVSIPLELLPEIDVFAMGATLYAMIVGRPPWMGNSIFDLAAKIKNIELTFPDDILDPHLKHLLHRLLDKDYRTRISLHEVLLDDWVTNEGIEPILLVDINSSTDSNSPRFSVVTPRSHIGSMTSPTFPSTANQPIKTVHSDPSMHSPPKPLKVAQTRSYSGRGIAYFHPEKIDSCNVVVVSSSTATRNLISFNLQAAGFRAIAIPQLSDYPAEGHICAILLHVDALTEENMDAGAGGLSKLGFEGYLLRLVPGYRPGGRGGCGILEPISDWPLSKQAVLPLYLNVNVLTKVVSTICGSDGRLGPDDEPETALQVDMDNLVRDSFSMQKLRSSMNDLTTAEEVEAAITTAGSSKKPSNRATATTVTGENATVESNASAPLPTPNAESASASGLSLRIDTNFKPSPQKATMQRSLSYTNREFQQVLDDSSGQVAASSSTRLLVPWDIEEFSPQHTPIVPAAEFFTAGSDKSAHSTK